MLNTKRYMAAFLCLAAAVPVSAQLSYADLLSLRGENRNPAASISMSPDGDHYTLRTEKGLVERPFEGGGERLLIEASAPAVGDFSISAQGLILYSDAATVKPIYRHSYTGDFLLAECGGVPERILTGARDASFSPDGERIAYSKENDLWLYDIAARSHTRITDDGRWNHVINGTSDWVYEEELGFTRAYAFSPDGRQMAWLRFDESAVPMFEMMRFDGQLYNRAYSFKYPKAGDRNSTVELWLYDIPSGEKRRIEVGDNPDQYILNLLWTPDGRLTFNRVNRLQNRLEVVLCEADGSQRTIYEERSPRYVEKPFGGAVHFVDADCFIVREETSTGWSHLYLHSMKRGRLHAITSGRWEVTSLVGFDRKHVWYISTERSPLHRDLYRISLDGRRKHRLTEEAGFCTVAASPEVRHYVQVFSNSATPNIVTVHRGDGTAVDTLADNRKAVASAAAKLGTQLSPRRFGSFVTERGDTLNYTLQLPADFDPDGRYPVLLTQYSGPGSQSVRDRWSVDWEDALPSHGYIVACCDGRGTGFRGEEFKKCTYGDLGRKEVEDQLSFARHLAAQPFVDAERMGIYGWSFGGFMALNCALHGDGLFRMAIAVAPVTSWRYYDTIYTEIYNGLPQDNPKGYDDNSPLTHAARLADRTRLLIMHGTADDNVHVQNTMEMCRRLNAEGKRYDMMVFPDQNHSMLPSATSAVRQRMIDYTLGNL